jgi:predicted GNAT family acetyltransferase
VQVTRHSTVAEFLARSKAWLETAEAENNVVLGIAGFFEPYSGKVRTAPYFLTLDDNGATVGAALMTPPRRLLITRMSDQALQHLVRFLLKDHAPVPGVLGPKDSAQVFAEEWTAHTKTTARLKMRERIYACTAVVPPASGPGYLRPATVEDQSLLVKWTGEFCRDANIEDEAAYMQSQVPTMIRKGCLYVWDDAGVVSMADLRRETRHGIAVSSVYTPSDLRNKGYATSCVAALTQRTLNSGKQFCCLFTDLANPTSNRIYQRIGYRPICDVDDWIFESMK